MKPDSEHRLTRRDFLRVAGLAAAGLAVGCNRKSSGWLSGGGSSPGKDVLYAKASPPAPPSGPPDLILRNGYVITVDAADTVAQAVAVKNGRIQAVGGNATIDALQTAQTQVIDLNKRTLTPGLIDPHFHLGTVALLKVYTPFLPPDVTDIASLQKALKEVAAQTPQGQWILGYFLSLKEARAPFAKELDVAAPDNPVWLIHQAGHLGSANTMAMQLAGITKDTPTPPGGFIGRDAEGNPTGDFYTHRAMDALRKAAPQELLKPDAQGLVEYQPLLVAGGITTFHDVYVRGLDMVSAYYTYGKKGQMTARCAFYPILENAEDVNGALKLEHYQDERFRLGGIKLQIDGQGPTAYTHQPHDGVAWDMPYWEAGQFKQMVRTLHDAGFQIAVHCVGDAAVDLTLDAYEEAMNANPRPDPRHRIEHCILSTQEAHKRMRDLGVVISDSPTFLPMAGNYYLEHYGKEREQLVMRTRDFLNLGIPVALNSDYPTTPWSLPQQSIAAAVGRKTATGQTVGRDQALTMMEALRAHTMGGAYAGFDESHKGSIEPGKLADLAVWRQNPLKMDAVEMFLTKESLVDMTFIGGKQVYPAT